MAPTCRWCLLLELVTYPDRVTRVDRLAILGRRTVVARSRARQLERAFIESRAAAALQRAGLGRELAFGIHADVHDGDPLFLQANRHRRIEIGGVGKSRTGAARDLAD